jgi:hypothetical protein
VTTVFILFKVVTVVVKVVKVVKSGQSGHSGQRAQHHNSITYCVSSFKFHITSELLSLLDSSISSSTPFLEPPSLI